MGYCKNCGAYIPDGHTKCLACGLDQTEQEEQASAYAAAKKSATRRQGNDELRRQLEEQRKKQQENNRKWVEAEYEQRRRAKEEQSRFDEARAGAGRTEDRTKDDDEFRSRKNVGESKTEPNKLFAVLSYMSILFVLPYLLCRNDEFAMFHARQGMILCVVGVIAKAIGSLLGLGWVATLLRVYFILKGAGNAANGKMEPLPYIGGFFNK